ncbi:MAG TPA: septum formation initiator family protein [Bacteroidota bacterium]|nr:septum formation initiator family protein [Bacteroidota bacterium]
MDDQFFRNLQPEKLLKKMAKKASKNKKHTIILVLLIFVALYIVFDNKGVLKRIRLEHEKSEWIQKVKADSVETKRLQDSINALGNDKKTLEKVARERYGMVRQGETVYQVKKDK